MTTISIIGSGKVGFSLGTGLIELGHKVLFHDINRNRLLALNRVGYHTTNNIKDVVNKTDVIFLCLPSYPKTNLDMCLLNTIKQLVVLLNDNARYHLIVVKSTLLPTTTEKRIIPLIFDMEFVDNRNIGFCTNPEFSTYATSTWSKNNSFVRHFFNQDRIVIGEKDKKSGNILERIYKPLNRPIFRTDFTTAEMIKYASNCLLATKISFWNEIFLICNKMGINSEIVSSIVSLDPRIGEYGAIHGKAFGGECLKRDLKAFVDFTKKYHFPELLVAVQTINEYMLTSFGTREQK